MTAPDPAMTGRGEASDETDMLDTLSVVVEHAPVAIAMFDQNMRYILANRQWVKEFNLNQALPLVGKSQYEVFPKLHPGWRQLYERALQGYTMRSDHAVQGAAGAAPVLFRCEARPWRHKRDASVAGIVVTCNKFTGAASAEAGADGGSEQSTGESAADSAAPPMVDALMDVTSVEFPVFVLDSEGRVLKANARAAELGSSRSIIEGETTLWEVLEDEPGRAGMQGLFEESVARMSGSSDTPPQILTVKSGPPAGAARSPGGVLPCRWLLARHGSEDRHWMALGLSGLSPFEAVAKSGLPAPAALNGHALVKPGTDPAVVEALRQEKSLLQAELAQVQDALRRSRAEIRTLREMEHKMVRRDGQQHSLAEALPAGVLVLDENGQTLQQNRALKALLGHEIQEEESVETWLGRACPDEAHRAEVQRIWREDVWRRQLTRTVSLVTADGLLKEIEMRPATLSQSGLLVHFQDVTELCRLDEQLSATESKYRALLQESPLAIVIADKAGAVYEVNRAAEELFQRAKVELRRLPVEALLAAEGAAARKDALREMRQSGDGRRRLPVQLAGADGPKMMLSLAVVPAADGGAHSTLHYFEPPVAWAAPATRQVVAQNAAAPSAPNLEQDGVEASTLKAAAPVLLMNTGSSGRVEIWTEAAAQLFGYTAEQMRGRPLHELFQPSNASSFYGTALPEAVRDGSATWSYSTRHSGRQSGAFIVRSTNAGEAKVELWQVAEEAALGVPVESTGRVAEAPPQLDWQPTSSLPPRPEWAMFDLNREQTLLAETHHRVHHHLNILSSLVNVQSNGVADAGAREALKSTQNRLRAVASLHQHLEKLASQPEASLRDFVEGLAMGLQSSLEVSPARVRVRAEIPEGKFLPKEWLMPLAVTLNETISNALEHGFPGGREGEILVRLDVEGDRARLVIEDEGIGMAEGAAASAERGMGLKIVSLFASQMRAQLEISGTPGKGTRIEMQFFIAFADN